MLLEFVEPRPGQSSEQRIKAEKLVSDARRAHLRERRGALHWILP
jgi:ribosomal protein L17